MAIPLEEALAIASRYANNLDEICRIVLSGDVEIFNRNLSELL